MATSGEACRAGAGLVRFPIAEEEVVLGAAELLENSQEGAFVCCAGIRVLKLGRCGHR